MSKPHRPCMHADGSRELSCWTTRGAAERAALSYKQRFGKAFRPYRCPSCGNYHLAPVTGPSRAPRSATCRGADGVPKRIYDSERDALRAAVARSATAGVSLSCYRCGACGQWHLTKASGLSCGRRN